MSKIIVEDHTQDKIEDVFEETYVLSYVNDIMPIIVKDALSFGLSPKEIVYSAFCLAESLKEYAMLSGHGATEDYEKVYDWAKDQARKYKDEIEKSGLMDKVKDAIKEYKMKTDKKEKD